MKKGKSKIAEPEAMPGARCNCARCGVECKVSPIRNEEARLLRHSKTASGMCANCAVTEWILNTYPVNMILEESKRGPDLLLYPFIQEQFMEIARAGNADITTAEINWQLVVKNWNLPLKVKTSPTNPHSPGDSVRRKLADKEIRNSSIGGMLDRHFKGTVPGYQTYEERFGWLPQDDPSLGFFTGAKTDDDESGPVN